MTNQTKKEKKEKPSEKIEYILLDERFNSGNFEYVLGKSIRLDLVHIVMKINEIINYLDETKEK